MSEQEEFEFRHRLEQESAAPQQQSTILNNAMRLARGFIQSGPIGMAATGVGMGWEGLEKGADVAAGPTVDVLAKHLPPEAAAVAGTAVKMAPTIAGGFLGTSAGGKQGMEKGARALMQSAMKPTSRSLANGDAAKAIDTMLQEGVPVTAGGAAALRSKIGELKGQVAALIAQSPGTVNKGYVFSELSKTLDDVTKQGLPAADRGAVLQAWKQFKNHPLIQGTNDIPVQMADELKRGTQRALKEFYRRTPTQSTPLGAEKAEAAIASGLRQGVEDAVPGVAAKNAKLSEYINALHQLEPRAAQAANRDLAGLAPIAETPEMAMAMLADRNPWLKSYVAKVLYDARNKIGFAGGAAAGEVYRTK